MSLAPYATSCVRLRSIAFDCVRLPGQVSRLRTLPTLADTLAAHAAHEGELGSVEGSRQSGSVCSSLSCRELSDLQWRMQGRAWQLGDAPRYPLLPQYVDERARPGQTVEYLSSPAQLRRHTMLGDAGSGRAVDCDGRPLGALSTICEAIFVLALNGDIVFSFELDRHRHSSLVAGADVCGAGSMRISNGRILEIDNFSGHYRPPAASLAVVVERLRQMGVVIEETSVRTTSNGSHNGSLSAASSAPPLIIDSHLSTTDVDRPVPRRRARSKTRSGA